MVNAITRLTRRSKVGEGLPAKSLHLTHMSETSEQTLTEILDKLAAYEDTGLTPEEIEQLMRRCHTAIELWTNTSSKFCKMYDEIEYWKSQYISDKFKLEELRIWLHDNDLDMDDVLRKVNK